MSRAKPILLEMQQSLPATQGAFSEITEAETPSAPMHSSPGLTPTAWFRTAPFSAAIATKKANGIAVDSSGNAYVCAK